MCVVPNSDIGLTPLATSRSALEGVKRITKRIVTFTTLNLVVVTVGASFFFGKQSSFYRQPWPSPLRIRSTLHPTELGQNHREFVVDVIDCVEHCDVRLHRRGV